MSKSEDNLLRSFGQLVVGRLREAYANKTNIDQLNGISLFHQPFTHCVISDVLEDTNFIKDLNKELKTKLKYLQKNNDLYKFSQTGDLARNKATNVGKFRDIVLYDKLLTTIQQITGIELLRNRVDVTSSKYEFSDYLLCHDDDIHEVGKHGRRIAFIYYLVPENWSSDGSDGGNLDLFACDNDLQPTTVVKSLVPRANSLLFFEVSDKSFHQVSEVLSANKTRYSINGWFHGKANNRPDKLIEMVPEPMPYLNIDANLFFDWIVEKYLKPMNQTEIQLKFSNTSEIKLDRIFHLQKYEDVSNALDSADIVWKYKGPANRRNYEVADLATVPAIVSDLVKVLSSDYMGLTLANMTGLALHSSVVKTKDETTSDDGEDDDDFDDDEEDDDSADKANDEKTEDDDSDDGDDDNEDDGDEDDDDDAQGGMEKSSNGSALLTRKRDLEHDSDSNISNEARLSSLQHSENLYKKFKSAGPSNVSSSSAAAAAARNDTNDAVPTTSAASESSSSATHDATAAPSDSPTARSREDLSSRMSDMPKCYCEVRRWKQGSYTLITDDDSQIKTKALDLMVFFKSKSWSLECGGNVSYIARDEDNELLTVNPDENCISIVYRDEETLKFTKYANTNIKKINNLGCFYEISLVYYE